MTRSSLEPESSLLTAPRSGPDAPIRSSLAMSSDAQRAFLEPAERFYWVKLSVADEAGTPAQFLHPRQRALVEEQLSAAVLPPLDGLEWVAAPAGASHVLVCLQERDAIAAVHATGVLHYGPSTVLQDLAVEVDPRSLNFLVGAFSPPSVVRAKRTLSIAAALTTLVVSALLAWGLERRSRVADAQATATAQQTASILRAEGQPSLGTLKSKRDQMAVTRQRLTDRSQADASLALASLLRAWPSGESAPVLMTDSVSIMSDQMQLQCSALTREDATRLAERLSTFPEISASGGQAGTTDRWVLGQPQITAAAGASPGTYPFKVSLRFSRVKGVAASPGVKEAHE